MLLLRDFLSLEGMIKGGRVGINCFITVRVSHLLPVSVIQLEAGESSLAPEARLGFSELGCSFQ